MLMDGGRESHGARIAKPIKCAELWKIFKIRHRAGASVEHVYEMQHAHNMRFFFLFAVVHALNKSIEWANNVNFHFLSLPRFLHHNLSSLSNDFEVHTIVDRIKKGRQIELSYSLASTPLESGSHLLRWRQVTWWFSSQAYATFTCGFFPHLKEDKQRASHSHQQLN